MKTLAPLQQIKLVYGLRDEHPMLSTCTDDGEALMGMDAPQLMPAGSMVQHQSGTRPATIVESLMFRDLY